MAERIDPRVLTHPFFVKVVKPALKQQAQYMEFWHFINPLYFFPAFYYEQWRRKHLEKKLNSEYQDFLNMLKELHYDRDQVIRLCNNPEFLDMIRYESKSD
jgi:hypothetical protein